MCADKFIVFESFWFYEGKDAEFCRERFKGKDSKKISWVCFTRDNKCVDVYLSRRKIFRRYNAKSVGLVNAWMKQSWMKETNKKYIPYLL